MMKATIAIKPTKMFAPTKSALDAAIADRFNCGWVINELGFYRKTTAGRIILVNYVKHRFKTEEVWDGNATASGQPLSTKRVLVRRARWDAYVYAIPTRMVPMLEQVQQNARNFSVRFG